MEQIIRPGGLLGKIQDQWNDYDPEEIAIIG